MAPTPDDIQNVIDAIRQCHQAVDQSKPLDLDKVIIVTLTDYINLDAELKNVERLFQEHGNKRSISSRTRDEIWNTHNLLQGEYRRRYLNTDNVAQYSMGFEPYQLDPNEIQTLMDRLNELVESFDTHHKRGSH